MSHRYDLLPLLPSGPGGIQRELVAYDFPYANILLFVETVKNEWKDIVYPGEFPSLFSSEHNDTQRLPAKSLIFGHHLATSAAWGAWGRRDRMSEASDYRQGNHGFPGMIGSGGKHGGPLSA